MAAVVAMPAAAVAPSVNTWAVALLAPSSWEALLAVLILFQEDEAEEAADSVPLLVAVSDVLVQPSEAEQDLLSQPTAALLFASLVPASIPLAFDLAVAVELCLVLDEPQEEVAHSPTNLVSNSLVDGSLLELIWMMSFLLLADPPRAFPLLHVQMPLLIMLPALVSAP